MQGLWFRTTTLVAALLMAAISGCGVETGAKGDLVRLPSGDSVLMFPRSKVAVPERSPGLLVRYHPFVSLEDTVQLKRLAVEVWHSTVQPRLADENASWVVLQATSRGSTNTVGVYREKNYGVVIERHGDGQWYYLDTLTPVE